MPCLRRAKWCALLAWLALTMLAVGPDVTAAVPGKRGILNHIGAYGRFAWEDPTVTHDIALRYRYAIVPYGGFPPVPAEDLLRQFGHSVHAVNPDAFVLTYKECNGLYTRDADYMDVHAGRYGSSSLAESITAGQTTIELSGGDYGQWPTQDFWVAIEFERIHVETRAGNVLTVTTDPYLGRGAAYNFKDLEQTGLVGSATATSTDCEVLYDSDRIRQPCHGFWINARLEMLSGRNAGEVRLVYSSFDSGRLWVTPPFPQPVEAGDQYKMEFCDAAQPHSAGTPVYWSTEDVFFHDALSGSRAIRSGHKWYLMNVTNQHWREHQARTLASWLREQGADGTFLDDCFAIPWKKTFYRVSDLMNIGGVVNEAHWGPAVIGNWFADMGRLMDGLKAGLPAPALVCVNNIADTGAGTDQLMELNGVDIGCYEPNFYEDAYRWPLCLDMMIDIQHRLRKVVLQPWEGGKEDHQAHLWGLASHLMSLEAGVPSTFEYVEGSYTSPHAYFNNDVGTTSITEPYFWGIEIGDPVAPYYTLHDGKLYCRDYEKGRIAVNPQDSGALDYEVPEPADGGRWTAWRPRDGSSTAIDIGVLPAGTIIQLQPKQAAILEWRLTDNLPPTAPDVKVMPDRPKAKDDLVCDIVTPSTDPNQDAVTYLYQWYRDGVEQPDETAGTLQHGGTRKGETWKCVVTPTDGIATGPPAEDSVTVLNSAPKARWKGKGRFVADGYDPNKAEAGSALITLQVVVEDADDTRPRRAAVRFTRIEDGRCRRVVRTVRLEHVRGRPSTGALYGATTTLPNGSYMYRFLVHDGESWGTGEPTEWHHGPRIIGVGQLWCTRRPGFEAGFLSPTTGNPRDTRFRFRVLYTDGEGQAPATHRLELQRRDRDGRWRAFATRPVRPWGGSPREGRVYATTCKLPDGEYRHRFVFTDSEGTATGTASRVANAARWQPGPVVTESAAGALALTAVAAVPTRVGAQITFSVSAASDVSARILNVAGRPVRVLPPLACTDGMNTLLWNGQSAAGTRVPAGTYLVEITARSPGGSQVRGLSQLHLQR